ncbi:MAG TPA: LamG domain-containing protein, partial [Thermoguttaceae bacterium]|nr:LamG domain-containing protein [Thermoguttaceae bacterium]
MMKAFGAALSAVGWALALVATSQAAMQGLDIGNLLAVPADPQYSQPFAYDAGTGEYTVYGGGTDIWDNDDEFHFVYDTAPLGNDAVVYARVTSLQVTNSWSKAGVMIRDQFVTTSTHAMMCVSGDPRVSFQNRPLVDPAGSPSYDTTTAGIGARPYWVKLTRVGNTLTGYHSPDGLSWTRQGSVDIAMAAPYAGLAVTSHDNNQLCEAKFDNFEIVRFTQTMTWDGTLGANWGSDHWGAAGAWPGPQTKAIVNSGRVNVAQDQSAFSLAMGQSTLDVAAGKTLTVGWLDAADGIVNLGNNAHLSIPHGSGAIGEINLSGTGTITHGDDLQINAVSIPAMGTFVKGGGATLAVGEIEAAQTSTIRIDGGMLTAEGPKPLGDAQNLILNGGTANLIGGIVIGTTPAGATARFSFDSGAALALDSAGGRQGVISGDPDWVSDGIVGGAIRLDGGADYITLPGGDPATFIDLTNKSFSTAFWAKRDTTDVNYVIGQGDTGAASQSLHIGFRDANQFTHAFYSNDLNYSNSAAINNTNDWHLWTTTFDVTTNEQTIYLDGELVSSRTAAGPFLGSGSNDLWIGRRFNGLNYAGLLDEVYFYDRALNAAEIADLAGSWSLNMSTMGVRVTADSTLMASLPDGDAQFGDLILESGVLTTTGTAAAIHFKSTKINVQVDGARSVGIDPQVPTDFGTIDGGANTVDFTFSKTGTSYLSVKSGFMQNMDNATIDAHQGTLAMIGAGAWAGSNDAQLSGGTLRIEPGEGTLAYWSLDDSANLGRDDSGAGHDLELINSPAYFKTGRFGGTARFDGARDTQAVDYDAADYLNGLDEVTIAMWIKADPVDPVGTGVDRGFWQLRPQNGRDEWGARYDAAGGAGGGTNVIKAAVTTTASGGTANRNVDQQESRSGVQTTNWQHVAITWENGEGFKLYLDGVEDTAPTSPMVNRFGRLDMVSYFMLGRGGRNDEWLGLIDEVYIANYALSAAEINAMKNDGFAVQAPEMPDLSSIAVAVTEPSTLSVGGDGGGGISTLQFGPLTISDGAILTTEGGAVAFNRLSPGDPADTTIAAGATAVGFDPRTDTRLGTINGNDAQV